MTRKRKSSGALDLGIRMHSFKVQWSQVRWVHWLDKINAVLKLITCALCVISHPGYLTSGRISNIHGVECPLGQVPTINVGHHCRSCRVPCLPLVPCPLSLVPSNLGTLESWTNPWIRSGLWPPWSDTSSRLSQPYCLLLETGARSSYIYTYILRRNMLQVFLSSRGLDDGVSLSASSLYPCVLLVPTLPFPSILI